MVFRLGFLQSEKSTDIFLKTDIWSLTYSPSPPTPGRSQKRRKDRSERDTQVCLKVNKCILLYLRKRSKYIVNLIYPHAQQPTGSPEPSYLVACTQRPSTKSKLKLTWIWINSGILYSYHFICFEKELCFLRRHLYFAVFLKQGFMFHHIHVVFKKLNRRVGTQYYLVPHLSSFASISHFKWC